MRAVLTINAIARREFALASDQKRPGITAKRPARILHRFQRPYVGCICDSSSVIEKYGGLMMVCALEY